MLLIRNTEVSTKLFSKFFHRGTSPEIISAACPFCLDRRRRARGQRVSRKADNVAYASVRMLAVSNAKILRGNRRQTGCFFDATTIRVHQY